MNTSENSNITAWIIIYIGLWILVLRTQIFALVLLIRDQNFRTNQKYLTGILCCTEMFLLIQFVMKGARPMNELENCVGLDLFIHFGDTVGGLMYLFVMTILTLDRFAEIKFTLKYPLHCNTIKIIALLILAFTISCLFYVGLFINLIINGNKPDWDELLIVYFISLFQGIFLVIAFMTYFYIFKKLRKNQLALNKIRNQLDQSSSRKTISRKKPRKPKIIVPSLIVLTFIFFSIFPHYRYTVLYHWSNKYRRTAASIFFLYCIWLVGWLIILFIYSAWNLFAR